ncbi:MAG: sigma-70 family RNA polymerase sigma factor [Acidobacteria bacterium]|nr:sigma-70 family RNA polymerase sigma factor [Acidobacteriota bacterium]
MVRARLRARGRLHPLADQEDGKNFTNREQREWECDLATPHDDLIRRETIDSVRQAVLALPEHYREAIILCDLHEMSYQEVAQILGCSLGTVRSRLHRGRLLLLDRLRGEMPVTQSEAERSVKEVI